MNNLEFSRNVSIGQYVDTNSYIHRLTPATKYLGILSFAVPSVVAPSWHGIAAVFALSCIAAKIARLRISFLVRGLKFMLPFVVFTMFLQFLFSWPGDESAVLFMLGPIRATAREAHTIFMIAIRTMSLMVVIGLFTSVTTERECAYGVEDALAPLARFGFPAHELALSVASAFRFIPIVSGELEAIVKAQASRGADFGTRRGGPIRKAVAYLPLFVPVMVRSLERAEQLAEAMEARCYIGEGRTRFARFERIKGEIAVRIGLCLFGAAASAFGFFA